LPAGQISRAGLDWLLAEWLKARDTAKVKLPGPAPGREGARNWARRLAPALAAGLAVVTVGLLVERVQFHESARLERLASEAVSDHLRQLARAEPFEIRSGGMHQVKPWFEGKLDFAPVVPVLDGSDLRLEGGAVGYFLDRRAAVLQYALRRHVVTLLIFQAEGIPWPASGKRVGGVEMTEASERGINVFLWRAGGLGYALVADVNAKELSGWAARLAGSAPP
ncbi:MAG TPA: hypothetical protein PLL32_09170, partial [Anaeromyxobacteraceae bacterium]|nr:hypothetical protein [Anaeromyxobacteraceae bacterium]